MKTRFLLMLMLAACAASSSTRAQGNVTIYGVIDAGVSYGTDVVGRSKFLVSDGILIGNRLGFRGSEDLGGGTSAIFTLESALNLYTGNGTFWQRQSFVGLSDSKLGTLTFGRQYEFTWDFVTVYTLGSRVGAYAFRPGDYDRLAGTLRINNSIKYVSPTIGGLKVGALVSAAEDGSAGNFKAHALGVSYENGPFSAAAAYNNVRNLALSPLPQLGTSLGPGFPATLSQDRVRDFNAAASYTISGWASRVVFSDTAISSAGQDARIRSYEFNEVALLTPFVSVSAGFTQTRLDPVKWNKVAGVVNYILSKRTNIYASATHVAASAGVKQSLLTVPQSPNERQTILRVGVMTLF